MAGDEERIRSLCAFWVAAAALPDGGTLSGEENEQFRLLANGVRFHELSLSELRAAGAGLSTVLLLPGLNTFIDDDHRYFWAWRTEILAGLPATGRDGVQRDRDIMQLLMLCCRAALATAGPTDDSSLETNSRELILGSHRILVYLAFPLLEAVAKRLCDEYVTPDGRRRISGTEIMRSFNATAPPRPGPGHVGSADATQVPGATPRRGPDGGCLHWSHRFDRTHLISVGRPPGGGNSHNTPSQVAEMQKEQ